MNESFQRYGVDEVLHLSSGDYRAVVSPQGGSIKTLTYRNQEIITVPLPVADFAFVGSAIAPWVNRLADASWSLDGVTYRGEITEAKHHNGLHGLSVRRDFEVELATETEVCFAYQFGSDEVYPFKVVFRVSYQLSSDGLRVTFSTENLDTKRVPITFGTHPYFAVDADSKLKVNAKTAAINDERQLPVGKQSIESIGLKNGEFAAFVDLPLDDCILDFEGLPETHLSRPALGLNVKVSSDANLPYQMLFVRGPKFAGENPVTVAIEPQSSPANALRTGDDLVWLDPQQIFSGSWAVSVESI